MEICSAKLSWNQSRTLTVKERPELKHSRYLWLKNANRLSDDQTA